jgi:hypothetical protein
MKNKNNMIRLLIVSSLLLIKCSLLLAQTPTTITATIPYLGVLGSGDYTCWNQNGVPINLADVTNPLIFVEGIDPSTDALPNGAISANNMYAELIASVYTPIGQTATTNLITQIQALGYDIIILNFTDGGDYIQRNAYVLEELIHTINRTVGEDAQPVVVGYSMGGVVARYALAHIEAQGLRHWCPLFVSFDSPQQGANVPLGLQAFTQIGSIASSADAALEYAVANLNCQAARQLLRYRLSSAFESDLSPLQKNQEYVDFFTELTSLNECFGFPTQCRNIAISLGSGQGVPQSYTVDLNAPAGPDQQHSGFEIANINGRTADGNMPVWDANCDGRIFPLTISFGTRVQDIDILTYPNSNDRFNYTGLQNWKRDADIAVKYKAPFSLGVVPLLEKKWRTAANDRWAYDMVPGSVMTFYSDFLEALQDLDNPISIPPEDWLENAPIDLPSITLQVACANSIGDESAFIPTVSALCYDYITPFEDIDANLNRLDFTPFDNIIYADANLNHNPLDSDEPTTQPNINAWLLDELSNWKGSTCRWGTRTVTGTITSGNTISENQANKIVVQNFDAQANSQGHLTAAAEIELLAGTDIKQSNDFIMDIEPCEPKACHFTLRNQTNLYRQAAPQSTTSSMVNHTISKSGQPVIFPNPNTGLINVEVATESLLQIFDLTGNLLLTNDISPGNTSIFSLPSSGIYLAKITNKQGYVFTQKIICNKN